MKVPKRPGVPTGTPGRNASLVNLIGRYTLVLFVVDIICFVVILLNLIKK